MKFSKVSSITITYNPNINILNRQLFSLKEQVSMIIVVDNCSNNVDDIETLVDGIENAYLIKLTDNIGIAGAQNQGIALAKSYMMDHIVLFDHDSDVPEGFVQGLLEAEAELLNKGFKVGAIGPTFSDADSGYNYPVSKFVSSTKYTGFKLERVYLDDSNTFSEVYFLIASGCLIRLNVLDDVGVMDQDLFIDNVDLEWCYRARNIGYKVFATSNAHLKHRIGDGSRKILGRKISIHSNLRKYYNIRNNLFLLKYDYVPLGAKIRCCVYIPLSIVLGFLDADDKFDFLKLQFYAFKDFFSGKQGKFNY